MEIYNTIEEAIKAQGLTITSAVKKHLNQHKCPPHRF